MEKCYFASILWEIWEYKQSVQRRSKEMSYRLDLVVYDASNWSAHNELFCNYTSLKLFTIWKLHFLGKFVSPLFGCKCFHFSLRYEKFFILPKGKNNQNKNIY